MAFEWNTWATHPGYTIADCGVLRGEWPTYAPTILSPDAGADLVGTSNVEKAFNYLANHGYTEQQAAGIVGNMIHESGVEPARLQGTAPGVITSPADAVGSSFGWGIVQWAPAGKMITPSRAAGVSDTTIASLGYQLDFLTRQLNGQTTIPEANAGDQVKATTSVEDAAVAFARYFERFAGSDDLSNPEYALRQATAVLVYNTYSGSSGSGSGGGGDSGGSGSWIPPLRVGILTCLPPPDGQLDHVCDGSYPTPYVWAERWGSEPTQTTGEYTPAASGGYTGSLDTPPAGMHVYALWYSPGGVGGGDSFAADGDSFASPRTVYIATNGGTYQSDAINGAYLSVEAGEPVPSASGSGAIGHTCWWTYTPTSSGSCTIDTELSDPGDDTILGVYTGSTITTLTEVASNDDSGAGTYGYLSSVTLPVTAGETYRIQAGSYSDTPPASLVLRVTGPAAGSPPPAYNSAPTIHPADGDSFAAPRRVYIPNQPADLINPYRADREVSYRSDDFGSPDINGAFLTTEPGEPIPSASGSIHGSCWWTYTPQTSGVCIVDTNASDLYDDTVLAVYTGTAINGLTEVASNDESGFGVTSWLRFSAVAGTTYRIQAGSFYAAYPATHLVLRVFGPAAGGPPPPAYFPGAFGRAASAPTLPALELVPQGMVAGSTGAARGGRKDGHWLDLQPRADRSFSVAPDSGGFDPGWAPGAYVARQRLRERFLERRFFWGWGHQFLVDYLEEQRRLLLDPDFVNIIDGEHYQNEFNPTFLTAKYPAATLGNDQSFTVMGGLYFEATYANLMTDDPIFDLLHYGELFTEIGMAGVSYRGSRWRAACLVDRTRELEYGIDYLPPPGPVPDSHHQSGYTFYEADHADFVRWEPLEVDVASVGGTTRTELGDPVDAEVEVFDGLNYVYDWRTIYPDRNPDVVYVPTQPLTVQFAKMEYQPLWGAYDRDAPNLPVHLVNPLAWTPYDAGTPIQTLDLGYPESTSTVSFQDWIAPDIEYYAPKPLNGHLQRLTTTLDFGADVEDLTIVLQLSLGDPAILPGWVPPDPPVGAVTGWEDLPLEEGGPPPPPPVHPFPTWDGLDFRPLTTHYPAGALGAQDYPYVYAKAVEIVAVDGMPMTFASMDGDVRWDRGDYKWVPDPSDHTLATRPDPFPHVTYNVPRWRYWVAGPVPAYIPLGDLNVGAADRPPIIFW
jgi:hypothetical protein